MSETTPARVEKNLMDLYFESDRLTQEIKKADSAWVEKDHLAKVAAAQSRLEIKARAIELGVKLTVQEIEDQSFIRVRDQLLAAATAESELRVIRAQIRSNENKVGIMRSVGTSVRSSIELS